MDDATLFDQIPAYALGALSSEESARVEAFLTTSEEAQAELRIYQAMLTGLATTTSLRQAPTHLTQDFRQRLSASPTVIPMPQRRVRSTRWIVMAAALLVVVVGALLAYRSAQPDPQQQAIDAILNDSSATKVALLPQPNISGEVTFVSTSDNAQGVLTAQLPPLDGQKQYQLWFIKNNVPPIGSIAFDATQENKPLLVTFPDTNTRYDEVAITIEPHGGSKNPTTAPIFVGKLS